MSTKPEKTGWCEGLSAKEILREILKNAHKLPAAEGWDGKSEINSPTWEITLSDKLYRKLNEFVEQNGE